MQVTDSRPAHHRVRSSGPLVPRLRPLALRTLLVALPTLVVGGGGDHPGAERDGRSGCPRVRRRDGRRRRRSGGDGAECDSSSDDTAAGGWRHRPRAGGGEGGGARGARLRGTLGEMLRQRDDPADLLLLLPEQHEARVGTTRYD